MTKSNKTNRTRCLLPRAMMISCVLLGGAATSAGNTTYYVDSSDGDDDHKGTSAHAAWKSLVKLCGVEFTPGDKILLRAGCRFAGRLHPKGSGAEGKPIVIDLAARPVLGVRPDRPCAQPAHRQASRRRPGAARRRLPLRQRARRPAVPARQRLLRREGPIVTRHKDGTIRHNQVTYQTKGFPFGG